jgi:HEAT repeat protein
MPSGTPSGGTRTGGKTSKKGPSYESWLFWWNYNKDEIVNIKARLRKGRAASTGGPGMLFGNTGRNEGQIQNLTAKAIEEQVVPLLQKYARDSKVNFDIQSAALISLSKIGRKEEIPFLMDVVRNAGTEKYHKVVEESAALALGIMQERSPEVRKFLGEVALDGAAKTRTRCFAMFALGLLGDAEGAYGKNAETLEVLKTLVASKESSKDIPNSALVAIGLLGDRTAIPDLVLWLNEEKAGSQPLNDISLSYAAAALGKIGQPGISGPESREVIDALSNQLNKKLRMTRYSTVIALGQIAPQGDEKIQKECVNILSEIVKSDGKGGNDGQAVNFAAISLGRIAGVKPAEDGTGGCPVEIREKAIDTLNKSFESRNTTTVSFSALALALAAMDLEQVDKAAIQEKISRLLAKGEGDFERRGALVISLGLLKTRSAVPMLVELLKPGEGDSKLRGAAAVALGLIGEQSAQDLVREVLLEKKERDLRVDAAVAAGLLQDGKAVDTLVDILKDPKSSQFILGSVAMALGQIGDQRAVPTMKAILEDTKSEYQDLTRALAAVALGQMGDKDDVPVMARISRDVNYRAYYDAIGELLTII